MGHRRTSPRLQTARYQQPERPLRYVGLVNTTEVPVLRKDAARNRARILQTAARVFAERGPTADVREIAQASGVGMGTLYRHFPTKRALLDAAIEHDLLEWANAAKGTVSEDPWTDLRRFLEDALTRHAAHRALLDSFGAPFGDTPNVQECRRRIRPVITELVARAQHAGVLRSDVTPVDIHLLLIALGRIVPLGPAAWRRQLDIALDGLASPNPTLLEPPAMSYEDVTSAITPTGQVGCG